MGFGKLARNIGNQATSPGMSRAVATSTGSNTPKRVVKHTGKGSSAGLNAHKKARLEMGGAGYSNPNLHSRGMTKSYPRFDSNLDSGGIFRNPSIRNNTFDNTKPKTLI